MKDGPEFPVPPGAATADADAYITALRFVRARLAVYGQPDTYAEFTVSGTGSGEVAPEIQAFITALAGFTISVLLTLADPSGEEPETQGVQEAIQLVDAAIEAATLRALSGE